MSKPRILIVDDERNIRRIFKMVLGGEDFLVDVAETGEEGLARYRDQRPDLVILDVRLPGQSGLEVLEAMHAADPEPPVLMISGHATIADAVEATRLGAFDFLEKPIDKERLLVAVRNALNVRKLGREVRALRSQVGKRHLLVGESPAIAEIRQTIQQVGPTPARVLITGESGTGKELVARGVHQASDRVDRPFVKVNCAAIPEELIESELFGAVEGAYTGATRDRDGKFLQADRGTLFLDEVGDMSHKAQAKVLRALQEGEIERVGDNQTIKVDVRVLAATNKDLAGESAAGRFREDLYFRLNVVPIDVPPLRARPGDVALLAEHFLAVYLDENGLSQRGFSAAAIAQLAAYRWPGNVRELGNAIERLAILSTGDPIDVDDLRRCGIGDPTGAAAPRTAGIAADLASLRAAGGLVAARREFERTHVAAALTAAGGNVSHAARLLGVDRTNLHKKIQAYGLASPQNESEDT